MSATEQHVVSSANTEAIADVDRLSRRLARLDLRS
jgi:hypothetical protein